MHRSGKSRWSWPSAPGRCFLRAGFGLALKVTVHTLVPSSSTLMLTPHSRAFGGMSSCARSPPSRPPRVLARPFFRDRPAMASSSSSEDEEAMLLSSCERPSTSCTRARAPRRAPRMCGTQERGKRADQRRKSGMALQSAVPTCIGARSSHERLESRELNRSTKRKPKLTHVTTVYPARY